MTRGYARQPQFAKGLVRSTPPLGEPKDAVASGGIERDAGRGEMLRVLEQLAIVVEEETEALLRGDHGVLATSTFRKGHALLEVSRAMTCPPLRSEEPELARVAAGLRLKLQNNSRVLKLHLDAVHEVTSVLSGAINDAEWDGTYSRRVPE